MASGYSQNQKHWGGEGNAKKIIAETVAWINIFEIICKKVSCMYYLLYVHTFQQIETCVSQT